MISFASMFDDSVFKSENLYAPPFVMRRVDGGRIEFWVEPNPLAAMCSYKDSHSTARLPSVSTNAKEAPAGICAVAGFDHRPGAWK